MYAEMKAFRMFISCDESVCIVSGLVICTRSDGASQPVAFSAVFFTTPPIRAAMFS